MIKTIIYNYRKEIQFFLLLSPFNIKEKDNHIYKTNSNNEWLDS